MRKKDSNDNPTRYKRYYRCIEQSFNSWEGEVDDLDSHIETYKTQVK